MAAPLSIIIPTLNSEKHLNATLSALVPGLNEGIIRNVILSDGGSSDNTSVLANKWGAKFVTGDKGRGMQLNFGAAHSNAEWYLFLHSDTLLSKDWPELIKPILNNTSYAYYFKLRFGQTGFAPWWVAGWANLRSKCFKLPYGDQALLISRKLFEDIGGYPSIPLMEDVAMAKQLRNKLKPLTITAITSADKYVENGWARQGFRNLKTLSRYHLGKDPSVLFKKYK